MSCTDISFSKGHGMDIIDGVDTWQYSNLRRTLNPKSVIAEDTDGLTNAAMMQKCHPAE